MYYLLAMNAMVNLTESDAKHVMNATVNLTESDAKHV
jgi:hypothetical protein